MYDGPGRYRHYKSGTYEVLGIGLNEETLLPVVVYRPTDDNVQWKPNLLAGFDDAKFWIRHLTAFNDLVMPEGKSNDEDRVERFQKEV